MVARLAVPGISARLWTGYGCLTGSERYVAATFAPVEVVNQAGRADQAAFLAIIDLQDRDVVVVEDLVALKYHTPGCGPGHEVAAVKYVDDGLATEVLNVDAATGAVRTRTVLDGRLSAPAPTGPDVFLSGGSQVVRTGPGGTEVAHEAAGEVVDLYTNENGGLDFLTIVTETDLEARTLVADGSASLLATGPVGVLRWTPGRNGENFLRATEPLKVERVAQGPLVKVAKLEDVVSSGATVVGQVRSVGRGDLMLPHAGSPSRTAVDGDLMVLERADGGIVPIVGTSESSSAKAPVLTVADQVSAVVDPNQQVCAIALNDPETQVVQPSADQVEWAAHRVVRGNLDVVRPANWHNNGLGSYNPLDQFGHEALLGGGRVPAQVLMGVLAQESNFWQASRAAIPGVAGNPLIGNYYGARFSGGRIISIDPGKADCGYGVGQITDGMRLDEAGGLFSSSEQRMIATDYLANMVVAHNILVQKWNQLWKADLITPDMDPAKAENWYFALWAYNSGYHTGSVFDPQAGLGWSNNPANSDYRFDRRYFLRASLADASRPGDWTYPERVLGFVENGLYVYGSRAFAPGVGVLELPVIDNASSAWRSSVDRFVLCTTHNDCDPDHVDPWSPGVPVRYDQSYCTRADRRCWWNQPAPFLPPAGPGVQENNDLYLWGDPTEPLVASPYPAACTADDATLPPFDVLKSFPAGTIIIDDVPAGTGNTADCSNVASQGTFDIDFASDIAAVDFAQIGTGYGGHFWYTHTNWETRPAHTITGTWTPPRGTTGWHRILVHIPTVGADTYQADYQIYDGSGNAQPFHRVVNQRWNQNQWVDLGFFKLADGARIELSNVTYSDHGRYPDRDGGAGDPAEAFYADGKLISIAWDSVALIPTGKPRLVYAALGDSYSSGEGDLGGLLWGTEYLPNSDIAATSSNETNACHRSTNAYGPVAFDALMTTRAKSSFATVACSGAKLENLNDDQTHWGEVPQLAQGWIDANTTHVSIGIGGNDADFSDVLRKCVLNSPLEPCYESPLNPGELPLEQQVPLAIEDLRPRYVSLIQDVKSLAPNAEIVMVGYPLVLNENMAPANLECGGLTHSEIRWVHGAVGMINAVISEVAAAEGVGFVDLVPVYDGKEACGEDEWINSVTFLEGWCHACNIADVRLAGSFHPNDDGHAAAGQEVASVFRSR